MAPFSFVLTVLLYALTASAAAVGAILRKAGSLEHVPSFGSNPTDVSVYIYVPKKLAAKPATRCSFTGSGICCGLVWPIDGNPSFIRWLYGTKGVIELCQ
jgi:hypothetical protein